jgi:multiple sugar transport system ATP-binding protein
MEKPLALSAVESDVENYLFGALMIQTEVKLNNIKKNFGETHVLHGIDLDINPGEFVVFVGPSGCGKTTLLRMIAGLEEITSGDLMIDGVLSNDLPSSKRGVAMVFQSYALYPHKTVYDNMAFGLKIAKVPKAEIDRRVREASEILQITEYLDRLPKALSGGQRQRVAIGRAIVRDPKVFLFDEPLSNLDAALRTKMRVELATLHRRLGSTMIYVTHDPGRQNCGAKQRPHRASGSPTRAVQQTRKFVRGGFYWLSTN